MNQYRNLDRVMEPKTILKSGASPKSQTSRRNIMKTIVRSIKMYVLFAVSCVLFSCQTQLQPSQQHSLSSKVSLGMTKNQVLNILGDPYRQVARYGNNGTRLEALHYQEKKAGAKDSHINVGRYGNYRGKGRGLPHGSTSSSTSNILLTHILLFENGTLVEIKEGNSTYGGRNSGQWWW